MKPQITPSKITFNTGACFYFFISIFLVFFSPTFNAKAVSIELERQLNTDSIEASEQVKEAIAKVEKTLNIFHQAAAQADKKTYLGLLTPQSIFLGTDASERWTKKEFTAFVSPIFSQGKGWLYRPVKRHVSLFNQGNSAFFDEILVNKKYGTCRGTGVLVNTAQGWKIFQYNLSIPVPNALSLDVVKIIKTHEQAANKS